MEGIANPGTTSVFLTVLPRCSEHLLGGRIKWEEYKYDTPLRPQNIGLQKHPCH